MIAVFDNHRIFHWNQSLRRPIGKRTCYCRNRLTLILYYHISVLSTLRLRQDGRQFSRWHIQMKLTISSDNGLVPNRRQAIIWTNDCLVYRRTYASLGPKVPQFVLAIYTEKQTSIWKTGCIILVCISVDLVNLWIGESFLPITRALTGRETHCYVSWKGRVWIKSVKTTSI